MSAAIDQLRHLGFDLTDSVLESLKNELNCDVDTLSFSDLLLGLGLGEFDYDTGIWTPYSKRVYAFDAEVFDIEKMYTLFLQGVQTIVPDLSITDIREDLSKMTDEMDISDDPALPSVNGKRSVYFVCNNHPYNIELDSYGDWFNEAMFSFMDQVLEKENCPFKLFEFTAQMQFVIMVYCSDSDAEKLAPLIDAF